MAAKYSDGFSPSFATAAATVRAAFWYCCGKSPGTERRGSAAFFSAANRATENARNKTVMLIFTGVVERPNDPRRQMARLLPPQEAGQKEASDPVVGEPRLMSCSYSPCDPIQNQISLPSCSTASARIPESTRADQKRPTFLRRTDRSAGP